MLLFTTVLTVAGSIVYIGTKTHNPRKAALMVQLTGEKKGGTEISLSDENPSLIAKAKATCLKFKEGKDGLSSARASSQQPTKSQAKATQTEISEVEKQANHYLSVASASLAFAAAGLVVSPMFTLVSIPITLYVFAPLARDIGEDTKNFFTKKPRITMNIVDGVILTGMLATGSFFASSFLVTFIWLSQKLLIKAEDHAQKSLIDVFSEKPSYVWLVTDDTETSIPFEELSPDDVIAIHAGELVPADGTVIFGNATIDQRILTGEAQPSEKAVGSQVFASTIVLSGQIRIKVEKAGQDTVAAQIGAILNQTANFTKTLEWEWKQLLDKLSPVTLGAGLITWPILGPSAAVGMLISVNFGYSMRVVAPLTLLNFLTAASKSHILIKDGRALEILEKIDTVVFDKTGTLTQEVPTVAQIHTLGQYSRDAVLTYAAAAERRQTHPVALAILSEAQKRSLNLPEISDSQYEIGYGLKVKVDNKIIRVGSNRFMKLEGLSIPAHVEQIHEEGLEQGHSIICIAVDDQVEGIIELVPTIRPEAKRIVAQLRERNISIYVISGDHEKPTQKLAKELGIEHYFAETLPEKKSAHIERLQAEGKCVCFVGDGINDSIALKKANLSVSLHGASSAAVDSASIILMDNSLKQLVSLFDIAQDFDRNMRRSFTISTIPTLISIGGVLFLNMTIVGTVILYFTGLGLGVGNSLAPLLSTKTRQAESPEIVTNAAMIPLPGPA